MPEFTNAHALVVGIACYKDSQIDPLPSAVENDARDVAELLKDRDRCGYPSENVKSLLNKKATRAGILGQLKALSKLPEDATVFLYFSCHGGQIGSAEYLVPWDTDASSEPTASKSALIRKLKQPPTTR